jgi:hypothetical protein
MLGMCIGAVLVVAAIASTSASALPEWGKCVAKTGGKYTNSNCTKKATLKEPGSFEFKKGKELAPVPFTGKNVGTGGVFWSEFSGCRPTEPDTPVPLTRAACEAKNPGENHRQNEAGGPAIECKTESNSGEAAGTNEVRHVHVKFTGCLLFGSSPCSNAGVEEVNTEELKGKLGYLSKTKKEVGILLEPVKKHGLFAAFECAFIGGIKVRVGAGNEKEGSAHTASGCDQVCAGTKPIEEKNGGYDGVISPITPVNEMTSTYTEEYKVTNTTPDSECVENTPNKFERAHIDVLEDVQFGVVTKNSFNWSCAGEEITNVNTASEPGEIKA